MDGGDVSYASLVPYLFMFAIVALLLGILMFALITLSDLESDLVNPHDCAVRLNSLLLPEIVLQSMLCTFFMVTLSVTGTVTNLPLLVYNLRMFFCGKMELDVTEIFKQLPGEKRQRMVKVSYSRTPLRSRTLN